MRHRQTSEPVRKILDMKTPVAATLAALTLAIVSTISCSHGPAKSDAGGEAVDATIGAGGHGRNYKYSDLVIRDYDEMNRAVQKHVRNAQKAIKKGGDEGEREAIEEMRDALKLILSRPNSDNMVAKLTPEVRRELSAFSAYEDTMASLAAECLVRVKDQNLTVARRSTDLFVLENMLNEIHPEIQRNEDMQRIVKRIADAHIQIDGDVINDRKIRSMFKTRNPSDMAQEMLKGLKKGDAK